jgi:hypothetical protein
VHERSASASVAIDEWVDRFELRVCESGVDERRQIIAAHEPNQVVDRRFDSFMMWRHERRRVRAIRARTDPYLLAPPLTGDSRVRPLHQCAVHLEDCGGVEVVGDFDRGGHCPAVADDLGRGSRGAAAQFGDRDRLR